MGKSAALGIVGGLHCLISHFEARQLELCSCLPLNVDWSTGMWSCPPYGLATKPWLVPRAPAPHLFLFLPPDALNPSRLLWLSPTDLTPVAAAPLPLRLITRAAPSPSYTQLVLTAADGTLALCSTACPPDADTQARGTLPRGTSSSSHSSQAHLGVGRTASHSSSNNGGIGGGGALNTQGSSPGMSPEPTSNGGPLTHGSLGRDGSMGPQARGAPLAVQEVARFHRGRVSACLWLSPSRVVTGGLDGTVRLWRWVGGLAGLHTHRWVGVLEARLGVVTDGLDGRTAVEVSV